jgi:hypothetical protein
MLSEVGKDYANTHKIIVSLWTAGKIKKEVIEWKTFYFLPREKKSSGSGHPPPHHLEHPSLILWVFGCVGAMGVMGGNFGRCAYRLKTLKDFLYKGMGHLAHGTQFQQDVLSFLNMDYLQPFILIGRAGKPKCCRAP